jgi:peroxiredoxin
MVIDYNYLLYSYIFEKNIYMKRNLLILFWIILISQNSFSQEKKVYDEGYIVRVGDKAPDFTISEAEGKTYKLSDLRGKVVMLQFTASWCSVCRTEMPFIEKEIWQEKQGEGLIVVGIDRDEPVEKVLQFKKDIKVTYPLALDPGADIFCLYAVKEAGVTRNVIIDRTGKIIFLTRLYKVDEFSKMKKLIFAELLAK